MKIFPQFTDPPPHSGVLWGGQPKLFYSINLLFMSNKTRPLKNLREVSKLFKCYVLAKNFDEKPTISLNTLKIGFLTRDV